MALSSALTREGRLGESVLTGDIEEDPLSITTVHPMREEAVKDFLARAGADWSVVHVLIAQGKLVEAEYGGQKFYMRRLSSSGLQG